MRQKKPLAGGEKKNAITLIDGNGKAGTSIIEIGQGFFVYLRICEVAHSNG